MKDEHEQYLGFIGTRFQARHMGFGCREEVVLWEGYIDWCYLTTSEWTMICNFTNPQTIINEMLYYNLSNEERWWNDVK